MGGSGDGTSFQVAARADIPALTPLGAALFVLGLVAAAPGRSRAGVDRDA